MDNFEDRRLECLGRLSTGDDACADSPKMWGNLPECVHSGWGNYGKLRNLSSRWKAEVMLLNFQEVRKDVWGLTKEDSWGLGGKKGVWSNGPNGYRSEMPMDVHVNKAQLLGAWGGQPGGMTSWWGSTWDCSAHPYPVVLSLLHSLFPVLSWRPNLL